MKPTKDGHSGEESDRYRVAGPLVDADSNSRNLEDVSITEAQMDAKESILLLRPTYSREIDHLNAPRSRPIVRRTRVSQSTSDITSSLANVNTNQLRSTSGDDFYPPITISEANLSSSTSTLASDSSSFDDLISIETRFSQIISEQQHALDRHRKSLGCIGQSTSCSRSLLAPDNARDGKCDQTKRRLSLCLPTRATSMVRDSLKNLASNLRTSLSNLSLSSYDRDIDATMKRLRAMRSSSPACGVKDSLRPHSPEATIDPVKPVVSIAEMPKVEVLHSAAPIVNESNRRSESPKCNEQCELTAGEGQDREQSEDVPVDLPEIAREPQSSEPSPEMKADESGADTYALETNMSTPDNNNLNSQVGRKCTSTTRLCSEDGSGGLDRRRACPWYRCCSLQ